MLQDPLSDDNPINPLAMVVYDVNTDVPAEALKKIIEKSDNCLERLGTT
ncbi:MAG TPA: hypothetical protein VL201_02010 [Patescibacteria group bacterium]|nr:hypothetical protein [Patescibacteria group bacterium]